MNDYEKATLLRKERKYNLAIGFYEANWLLEKNSASLAGILHCLRASKEKNIIEKGLQIIELILEEDYFVDWCENEMVYFISIIVLKKESGFNDFNRLNIIFSKIVKKFRSKDRISYIASKMSNYYSDKNQIEVVKRLKKYVNIEKLKNDKNLEWSDRVTYIYRLYKCFLEAEDYSIDFEVLPEIIKTNPKSELHFMRLYAHYLRKMDIDDKALKIYKNLEKYNKDYILNEIGDIYYYRKEFSKAANYYARSVIMSKVYDKKYWILKRLANCFVILEMDYQAFYTFALILNNNRFSKIAYYDADSNIEYTNLKEKLQIDETTYGIVNKEFRSIMQKYIGLEKWIEDKKYSGEVERVIRDYGFIKCKNFNKSIYFKQNAMNYRVGDILDFEVKKYRDKKTNDIKYAANNISLRREKIK